MSYQVLARKWRPKQFADLVGQEHVVRALTNALREGRLHHAYVLTGTRGVGKTTIARILAKSLNCEMGTTAEPCGVCATCTKIDTGNFIDLLEIDAASHTGVDNIREILENAQYAPTSGRYKVYIIDEVHMLSKSAFNAMLKTLEEPPEHLKFILATTDPQKLPVTVLSRCLQFSLRNLLPQQIASHLTHVLTVENIPYEPNALALIGRAAAGSMRDALSLLDQAIAYGDIVESSVRAMLGIVDNQYVYTLIQALATNNGSDLMAQADAFYIRGISADSVLAELAQVLQQLAIMQTVPDAIEQDYPDRDSLLALSQQITPEDVQLYYQIALMGRKDLPLAPDERIGLNMTLLRMLAFFPETMERPAPVAANTPAIPAPMSSLPTSTESKKAFSAKQALSEALGSMVKAEKKTASVTNRRPIQAEQSIGAEERQHFFPSETKLALSEHDTGAVTYRADQDVSIPDAATTPITETPTVVFDGDWPALVAQLNLHLGAERMLAQNAALQSWKDRRFLLTVSADAQHLMRQEYQNKLEAALSVYFHQPIRLQVTVSDQEGQETPAKREARQRQEKLAQAKEALQNDPFVQRLCNELGAVILTDTIKSVEE